MNRQFPALAPVVIALLICANKLLAADGSWSQATAGNQDWANTANWAGGVLADGPDSYAIFNANLPNDQSVTNAGGRTVGHILFQDSDTATAGGDNLGSATNHTGSLHLDVSS